MATRAARAEAPAVVYVCRGCGAVSHNPNDARHRYCGRCHAFHDEERAMPDPKRHPQTGLHTPLTLEGQNIKNSFGVVVGFVPDPAVGAELVRLVNAATAKPASAKPKG